MTCRNSWLKAEYRNEGRNYVKDRQAAIITPKRAARHEFLDLFVQLIVNVTYTYRVGS